MTLLTGWGATIFARLNFDGPHMWHNRRTPRRMFKKAVFFVCDLSGSSAFSGLSG
jgi:hypothetical protein